VLRQSPPSRAQPYAGRSKRKAVGQCRSRKIANGRAIKTEGTWNVFWRVRASQHFNNRLGMVRANPT
jgi:hypothetical protein